MSSPGMATTDSSGSQPQSFDRSVNFERLYHVCRACRVVPAGIWKNRANNPLVNLYRDNEERNKKLSDVFHALLPCKVKQEWDTYFVILANTYGRNSKEAE